MVKISVLTPTIRHEGLAITEKSLREQTFTDFEWLVEENTSGIHDLNAAYNRLLRRSKGELIVSLQDYIKVRPDYLQNFWEAYQEDKNALFTAPVGKVNNLNYEPPAKWDWRAYEDAKPDWKCWEIDSGAAPREMFFQVGGFDEYLDKYWSWDNQSVAKRADALGYKVKNLFDNPAIAYDHDAFIKHPFRGKERPKLVELRMDTYKDYPLRYL